MPFLEENVDVEKKKLIWQNSDRKEKEFNIKENKLVLKPFQAVLLKEIKEEKWKNVLTNKGRSIILKLQKHRRKRKKYKGQVLKKHSIVWMHKRKSNEEHKRNRLMNRYSTWYKRKSGEVRKRKENWIRKRYYEKR